MLMTTSSKRMRKEAESERERPSGIWFEPLSLGRGFVPLSKESLSNAVLMEHGFPDVIDFGTWRGSFTISKESDSPFAGGVYFFDMEVPAEYPMKGPIVRITTPIFHPLVDPETGYACVDILSADRWSPALQLKHIGLTIANAVESWDVKYPPDADDCLNKEALALMKSDPKAYEARVREQVAQQWDFGVVTE